MNAGRVLAFPFNDDVLAATYTLVGSLLTEHFGVTPEQCRQEALLDEDLCLDSLELVDFALMIEACNGVVLREGSLDQARTLGDLVEVVAAAGLACQETPRDNDQTHA